MTKGAKGSIVDWEESEAIANGQGPVYVLAEDSDERERIRGELIDSLDGLEHEGRRIVDDAVPAEEVYDGPYLDAGPNIVLSQASGVHAAESVGGARDPFGSPTKWHGENKETGLFLAHGPDVDPEAELPDMHILDIAPTVLHLMDTPIPRNLDSEPRVDLFAEGSNPATR